MKYFIAFLLAIPLTLSASANNHIYESQKLLFITNDSFAVVSTENESTPDHQQRIIRSSIKTYDMETNELIGTTVLSEHLRQNQIDTNRTTFADIRASTQPISAVVTSASKILAGYSVDVSDDFAIDEQGVYYTGTERQRHVLPISQIRQRLKFPVDDFQVWRMHKEQVQGITRFFLIIRSTNYGSRQDISEYEIVMSLPEN